MDFFTDFDNGMTAISGLLDGVANVEEVPAVVSKLDDAALVRLISLSTQMGQMLEWITLVASGVIGSRSGRRAGHSGLAQSLGHRSSTSLVQQVAGISRGAALRQVRVGEALIEEFEHGGHAVTAGAGVGESGAQQGDVAAIDTALGSDAPRSARRKPWHAPLTRALMQGQISSEQHDAIRRGLGEPPSGTGTGSVSATVHAAAMSTVFPSAMSAASPEDVAAAATAAATAAAATAAAAADQVGCGTVVASGAATSADLGTSGDMDQDAYASAWSLAAERLVADAALVPVEELAKQARAIRDLLDPEGALARHAARYEARSFRMWTDRNGSTHGKFVFDDESAAWLRTIIDSALRPRRGGPRFVDPNEQESARMLREDPRSNDQLTHDLLLDVLKAGAIADAETVFGTRQAGVRIVQVVDRESFLAGEATPLGRYIDGGETLPEGIVDKQRCNTGTQTVIADRDGNPLNVGREQRLYTAKQRIALAIRDGGCRWNGCDRPASYCEAHHIDHWNAEEGRTDIDRGILLCSFHHMQLHNNGWKITRHELGPFMLHPPRRRTQRTAERAPRTAELANRPAELANRPAELANRSAERIPRMTERTPRVAEPPPESPQSHSSVSPANALGIPKNSSRRSVNASENLESVPEHPTYARGRALSRSPLMMEPPDLSERSDPTDAVSPAEATDDGVTQEPIVLSPRRSISYGWQLATPPAKRMTHRVSTSPGVS